MNCQICGTFVATSRVACNNCGSRVSPETGNAFSAQKLFTRGITVSLVSIGVLVLAITGVSFANGANAVAVLVASAQQSLGNYGDLEDASSLLPETDESENFEPDNSKIAGPDDEGSDGGSYYSLTPEQEAEGFEIWEGSPIAWRWLTSDEKANLSCESEFTCTWVKVIALDVCGDLQISADISDQDDVVVGTGPTSASGGQDAQLEPGDSMVVEVSVWETWDFDTWMTLTGITCIPQE